MSPLEGGSLHQAGTHTIVAIAAVVKAVIITALLMAVDNVSFIQGLVTVVVSASVSGLFLLTGVYLTGRQAKEVGDKVETVHHEVNAKTDAQTDRVEQLGQALQDSGIEIPKKPTKD